MKNTKKFYLPPEVDTVRVVCDIITYSETEEWEGPMIEAAEEE